MGTRTDWTRDETGRSNSSVHFKRIVAHVERLIREDAHKLIAGRADMTAGLIVAQLAHVYGFEPVEETYSVEPGADVNADGDTVRTFIVVANSTGEQVGDAYDTLAEANDAAWRLNDA